MDAAGVDAAGVDAAGFDPAAVVVPALVVGPAAVVVVAAAVVGVDAAAVVLDDFSSEPQAASASAASTGRASQRWVCFMGSEPLTGRGDVDDDAIIAVLHGGAAHRGVPATDGQLAEEAEADEEGDAHRAR